MRDRRDKGVEYFGELKKFDHGRFLSINGSIVALPDGKVVKVDAIDHF
jgi:hypothetical protein